MFVFQRKQLSPDKGDVGKMRSAQSRRAAECPEVHFPLLNKCPKNDFIINKMTPNP